MLDEPLGALDRALRRSLLDELDELLARIGLPIVYVTHDHEEAMAIGDRVAVMRCRPSRGGAAAAGAVGTPAERVRGALSGPQQHHRCGRRRGPGANRDRRYPAGPAQTPPTARTRLLIRPDGFRLARPIGRARFSAVVRAATFRGDHTLLRVAAGRCTWRLLEVEDDRWPAPTVGDSGAPVESTPRRWYCCL